MNVEQYEALRANRYRRCPRKLSELPPRGPRRVRPAGLTPLGHVVAEAAELLRRREVTEAAWLRVVPAAWSPATRVLGLAAARRDTATIAVSSSSLLFELRRRQARLERDLARLAPGIRHLQFVLDGGSAPESAG
ncbi:MAG TPA: hypothetical protein PLQ87_00470 [Phycisphaerae bacterium]|nr:hypothetical protein [Phycisphaerae bacterium]